MAHRPEPTKKWGRRERTRSVQEGITTQSVVTSKTSKSVVTSKPKSRRKHDESSTTKTIRLKTNLNPEPHPRPVANDDGLPLALRAGARRPEPGGAGAFGLVLPAALLCGYGAGGRALGAAALAGRGLCGAGAAARGLHLCQRARRGGDGRARRAAAARLPLRPPAAADAHLPRPNADGRSAPALDLGRRRAAALVLGAANRHRPHRRALRGEPGGACQPARAAGALLGDRDPGGDRHLDLLLPPDRSRLQPVSAAGGDALDAAAGEPERRARGQGLCQAGLRSRALRDGKSHHAAARAQGHPAARGLLAGDGYPLRRADAGRFLPGRAHGDCGRHQRRHLHCLRRAGGADHLADSQPGPHCLADVDGLCLVRPHPQNYRADARAAGCGDADGGVAARGGAL